MPSDRKPSWVFAIAALLGTWILAGPVQSQPAAPPAASVANPWLTLAPFPDASEEVLGATANGKLYVFAGLAPGFKPKGLVYEYDPASNQWTKKKPMPLPSHHVALVSLNDKIFAFGGFKLPESGPPAWMPIDNAWEYDPATDEWKALAPMPTRRGAAGAAVVNGKIYVIGGSTVIPGAADIHPTRPHQVLNMVEEYDPASNSWRARAAMPTPRNHHVVAAAGNKIYAIGGRIGAVFITRGGTSIDTVEAYDPATDAWSIGLERMPSRRSAGAGAVYNGRIIVSGGEFQDRSMLAAFRAVEAYDPTTNAWHILPSMPHPRHGLAGGVIGNRLYLVSGEAQSAQSGAHAAVPFNEALQLDLLK